jgi:hypothetical protein
MPIEVADASRQEAGEVAFYEQSILKEISYRPDGSLIELVYEKGRKLQK